MPMKDRNLYLILDNIRSKENVGSIFRTADAFGVERVYLCGYTPQPTTHNSQLTTAENSKIDKIAKTALGAEKWVPWEYHKQTWRLIMNLKVKSEKLKVIALEQSKKSQSIYKYKSPTGRPMALVVGNEVRGLSAKTLSLCDDIIEIPMRGKKESLNVAVAAGIALYALTERDN